MHVKESAHYRAVSMELAAYLDGQYVEMRIATASGESRRSVKVLSVVCVIPGLAAEPTSVIGSA